jgi:STE24 endopeptidase
MTSLHPVAIAALALIFARWFTQLALDLLNRRHVQAHSREVPRPLEATIDSSTYAKAVTYTLAKNRLAIWELSLGTLLLIAVLFSGVLPWAWERWTEFAGTSPWSSATGLFLMGAALAIPSLPLDWWAQFRLEERFGFNTSTQWTWWLDRLKGLLLSAILGIPLLALLLAWVRWVGDAWWIWGAVTFIGFQLVLIVVAPILILPLFNKFQPLTEGTLRERLFALAKRTDFKARDIEIMDGSRRSRHANAFFTGLGRFRKIVLFDTLVNQLEEAELEAVLAHEIGHFRLWHIPKRFGWSIAMTIAAFAVVGWLAHQQWFFSAFGFSEPSVPVALLLMGLLAEAVAFWIAPLDHAQSRRFEYQADAFAAAALGNRQPMVSALRKLHTKNLANLTPHPWYSRFHYSHPTLLEREQALAKAGHA